MVERIKQTSFETIIRVLMICATIFCAAWTLDNRINSSIDKLAVKVDECGKTITRISIEVARQDEKIASIEKRIEAKR